MVVIGSLVNMDNLDIMDNMVKWLSYNLDPRLRHSRRSLEFGFFLPEARKVKPPSTELRTSSIIRANCTFDAKKVLEYRLKILVTRFGKVT